MNNTDEIKKILHSANCWFIYSQTFIFIADCRIRFTVTGF